MAGLVLEVAQHTDLKVDIEVVPGVTALSAVASLLGAPVVSDFAVISLSDLLTPWAVIEQLFEAAHISNISFYLKISTKKSLFFLLYHYEKKCSTYHFENLYTDTSIV